MGDFPRNLQNVHMRAYVHAWFDERSIPCSRPSGSETCVLYAYPDVECLHLVSSAITLSFTPYSVPYHER